ncbi:MAG: hypothetical protein M1840_005296 [Geoglossum simile]|nr:MAG: hypothetical protein M1840_005296 [Geoglossum simile]
MSSSNLTKPTIKLPINPCQLPRSTLPSNFSSPITSSSPNPSSTSLPRTPLVLFRRRSIGMERTRAKSSLDYRLSGLLWSSQKQRQLGRYHYREGRHLGRAAGVNENPKPSLIILLQLAKFTSITSSDGSTRLRLPYSRVRLVEQYRLAFSLMIRTDMEQFAEKSYFASREQGVEEEGRQERGTRATARWALNLESEDEDGKKGS